MSTVHPVYINRNKYLSRRGIDTYGDYLKGEQWKGIRLRVLKHFGFKCWRCGEKAHCVHHATYSKGTLNGRHLSGLVPVCGKCHQYAEYDGKRKCSPEEANKRLGIRLNRRCIRCGRDCHWEAFAFADSVACVNCDSSRHIKPRRKRLHSVNKFRLVGGPHDGELVKPKGRRGQGLPTLWSMECELAGGFGFCRSTYEYDASQRVYRFLSMNIEGGDGEELA